jgi:hypothetical protein
VGVERWGLRRPRVLVGCETSGVVRRAFAEVGVDSYSCDLLPAEDGETERHIVADVRRVVAEQGPWDLLIVHPPCTRLASSGARWMAGRQAEIEEALDLVRWLLVYQRAVGRVCLENPVGLIGTRVRPADQIIQPWMFGHGEVKATCLWLRRLPKLRATQVVRGRRERVWRMSPGPERWRERSRTYAGIGRAMAEQWGLGVLAREDSR